MKKFLTISCMLAMAACAFAAGNLKADDCEVGNAKNKATIKGDFKYSVDKGIVVEDKSKSPIKNGDVAYSKRIKTAGVVDGIIFSAKKGEVVTVVATSAGKNDSRTLTIRPADNQTKKIGSLTAPAWNASSPSFTTGSVTIPKDGEYIIRGSSGGGLYIFEIDIK